MSLQGNPITLSLENNLLQPWTSPPSQLSLTQDVSSQGYPPNVSASLVTNETLLANLELVSEPVELRLTVGEGIEFLSDNLSLWQVPVVRKETKIKTAAIRPSDVIVHDIDELMAGKEDEAKPTEFAYAYARRVIESAYGKAKVTGRVPTVLPKPLATTDDVGGIRLLWNLGARNIRLNFGAARDRQSYLYYEADLEHGVEPLNDENLVKRLDWLTGK